MGVPAPGWVCAVPALICALEVTRLVVESVRHLDQKADRSAGCMLKADPEAGASGVPSPSMDVHGGLCTWVRSKIKNYLASTSRDATFP